MKYLNKTNLSNLEDSIGLYNTIRKLRRMEFSFMGMEEISGSTFVEKIIGQIQNFCLLAFQNRKA